MAIVAAREAYFETGLEILADLGLGRLKLAEVCGRLGVTTGSFYHYFTNWGAYTSGLIAYWREDRTVRLAEMLRREPDPRRRMRYIIEAALSLPHGAEAAIRAWSSVDADVHAVTSWLASQPVPQPSKAAAQRPAWAAGGKAIVCGSAP
jgi:AcrR family transcriptional regulator